ncbi:MAG: hypothetical protein H6657_20085 [Ardenticatenaceae bacterium]|nr:hypothetical protein [Ardenticatenaceae bacterium]
MDSRPTPSRGKHFAGMTSSYFGKGVVKFIRQTAESVIKITIWTYVKTKRILKQK